MKKTIYSGLLLLFAPFLLQAQTDSTASRISISGYIDSYFFKNLNNPASGSNLGPSGFERIFDQTEGQFQLGLVQTKFAYSTSKSDVVVDLTFGPNADLGNYGNAFSPNVFASTSTALAIKQAYFSYKFTDKFNFTVGQFGTHIGYEVIDAPVNYNYSLSNLFGNGPFYHLGLKANYAISDKVGIMAGIVNNWDSNYDNNKFKTGIAQLFVSPTEGWNVYLNWIGGNENPADGAINGTTPKGFKQMVDLTTSYQISDKFLLGLNYAYGSSKNKDVDATTWGGAALYANYAATDFFGLGVRAEYFDNTSGTQYLLKQTGTLDANGNPELAGTDVTSITVTGNFTLAEGHLLIKPEFRTDMFKKVDGAGLEGFQQFEDNDGNFTKNSQSTLGVAFIYKF